MPLPRMNSIIPLSSVYPDGIRINCQYFLSTPIDFNQLRALQTFAAFQRIRRKTALRGHLREEQLQTTFQIEIWHHGPRAPLSVYVNINPLTYMHNQRSDYEPEQGREGELNWLHPNAIRRRDNRRVWETANLLILSAESLAYDFVNRIADAIGGGCRATYFNISIAKVEVAIDFAAADPNATVRRYRPNFRRQFRHTGRQTYRRRANDYESESDEILMLSGYNRQGVRFKFYEKTNRRVRLECQIEGASITSLGLRRSIPTYDDNFVGFFAEVARLVVPQFNELLQHLPRNDNDDEGPIDLITQFVAATRNVGRAQECLRRLARGRPVRSRVDRAFIRRLSERGVLRRIARGSFFITNHYAAALRTLARLDRVWRRGS